MTTSEQTNLEVISFTCLVILNFKQIYFLLNTKNWLDNPYMYNSHTFSNFFNSKIIMWSFIIFITGWKFNLFDTHKCTRAFTCRSQWLVIVNLCLKCSCQSVLSFTITRFRGYGNARRLSAWASVRLVRLMTNLFLIRFYTVV